MRHIQTYIVSRHLATRGNTKILRTPPPHISSSEEILPASPGTPLPNSEQINHPSSIHTYTKSTPNHIQHHYAPSITLTYTTHFISSTSPTYAPHYHPGFADRPRRSASTVGQMDGENWLVDHKRVDQTPLPHPTSKGHGSGYTTTINFQSP